MLAIWRRVGLVFSALGDRELQLFNLAAVTAPAWVYFLLRRPEHGLPLAAMTGITASMLLWQRSVTRHTTRPTRAMLLFWSLVVTLLVWLAAVAASFLVIRFWADGPLRAGGGSTGLALYVFVVVVLRVVFTRWERAHAVPGAAPRVRRTLMLAQLRRSVDPERLCLLVVLATTVLRYEQDLQPAACVLAACALVSGLMREFTGDIKHHQLDALRLMEGSASQDMGAAELFGAAHGSVMGLFEALTARSAAIQRRRSVIASWIVDFLGRRRPDLSLVRIVVFAAGTPPLSRTRVSPQTTLAEAFIKLAEELLVVADAESRRDGLPARRAQSLSNAVHREYLGLVYVQATLCERGNRLDEALALRERTVELGRLWVPEDVGYFRAELLVLLCRVGRFAEGVRRALDWAEEPATPGYMRQRMLASAALMAVAAEGFEAAEVRELAAAARAESWTARNVLSLAATVCRYRHVAPLGRLTGVGSARAWRRQTFGLIGMAEVMADFLEHPRDYRKPAAAEMIMRSMAEFVSVGANWENRARHLATVGLARSLRGRRRRATRMLRRAVRIAERDRQPPWALEALRELSKIAYDRGRYEQAFRYSERALAYVEQARVAPAIEELRLFETRRLEEVYAAHIELLLLYCLAGRPGQGRKSTSWPQRPELAAYEAVESAKSRLLSELLGSAMTVPEATAEAGTERRLSDEHARAVRALEEDGRSPAAVERARLAREALDGARARLRGLGGQAAEYADLRAGRPLDFARARALLAADSHGAVLCTYYGLDAGTFALLIARPELPDPVLVGVRVDPELVARGAESARQDSAARLRAWNASEPWLRELVPLIAPLAEHTAPGEQIWFVPHVGLHHIPLHALMLDGKPLAARNPVCYTPNVTTMWHCRERPRSAGGRVLLAVDPDGSLPLLRSHAREITALWGDDAQCVFGEEVTASALTGLLAEEAGYRVVHIASHGVYDVDQPLHSGIATAPDQGGNAGRLTAADLLAARCRADLVVLAACDTGVNAALPGDELIGLTRAIMYAGAKSVLVSLWPVDQTATAFISEDFHAGLAAGQGPARALQAAQAQLRERTAQQIIDDVEFRLADPAMDPDSSAIAWLHLRRIKAREAAGDHRRALRECVELALCPALEPALAAELRRAGARCRRAAHTRPAVLYQVTPYQDPFFWSAFVLVGEWL